MIVVYRFDDLSHSHALIQVQSDPLSSRFLVFLISHLELFAKVHAPEAGRHAHVMTTADVRPQLDFATDFVYSNCCTCTAILISVRHWQKNARLRDRRTCNVKDEMRNMEYETLQVQTTANTIEPATTIFCYKHA